jgi:predicted DCC family thiol-disulfide oxidoreductase YuxK
VDGSVNDSSSSSSTDGDDSAVVADWDWEKLANLSFAEDKRPIVLFDGVCNLCSGGINFAMDQDESAKFRFCSIQSKVAQSLLLRAGVSPNDKSNIALMTEDDSFFSSDAVSRICMELDAVPLQWFGQLGQFTPDWIRESIYELVSDNRYKFGENDSCRLDFDGVYTSRFVSDPTDD